MKTTEDGELSSNQSFFGDTQPVFAKSKTILLTEKQAETICEDPFARAADAPAPVPDSDSSPEQLDKNASMAEAHELRPVSTGSSWREAGADDEQAVTSREDPFARSVDTASVPVPSSAPRLDERPSEVRADEVASRSTGSSWREAGADDEQAVTSREDPFARSVDAASVPDLPSSAPRFDEKPSEVRADEVASRSTGSSWREASADDEQAVTSREDPFARSVDTVSVPDSPSSAPRFDEKPSPARVDEVAPTSAESSWKMTGIDEKQAETAREEPFMENVAFPGSMPDSPDPQSRKKAPVAKAQDSSMSSASALKLAKADESGPTPPPVPTQGSSVEAPGSPVRNLAPAPAAVEAVLGLDPNSSIQNQPDIPESVPEQTKRRKGPLIGAIMLLLCIVIGTVIAWPLVAQKIEDRRLANLIWPPVQLDGVLKAGVDSPAKAILSGEIVPEGRWSPDGIEVIKVEHKQVLLGFEGAQKWVLVGDRTN